MWLLDLAFLAHPASSLKRNNFCFQLYLKVYCLESPYQAASGPSASLQSMKSGIILPTEHKGIYIAYCHFNIIIFQLRITLKEWQIIGFSICIGPSEPLLIVHSSFVILPVLMLARICCGVVVLPYIKHCMLYPCLCSSHVSLYT